MKSISRILSLMVLLVMLAGLCIVSAAEVTIEQNGLRITVETDKLQYEQDESISARITVKNIKEEKVIISNLEQLIPEGYKLDDRTQAGVKDIELFPGDEITLDVILDSEAQAAQEGDTDVIGNFLEGKTLGIPNIIVVIVVIALIVIFMLLT